MKKALSDLCFFRVKGSICIHCNVCVLLIVDKHCTWLEGVASTQLRGSVRLEWQHAADAGLSDVEGNRHQVLMATA